MIQSMKGITGFGLEHPVLESRVWECVELKLTAAGDYANPYLETLLHGEFIGPGGERLVVPGYWDGDREWRIRFAPTVEGTWTWRTRYSNAADSGLNGQVGILHAKAWTAQELADNPNRHGFLRVHPSGRFFEYADGTPFYWLGDTLWAAHTLRCHPDQVLPEYLADRRAKGFTVIQLVAAHPTGDEQGEDSGSYVRYGGRYYVNEGGAPFLSRYDRINPAYFRALDRRILMIAEQGFVPCLMGMWGQELQGMPLDSIKRYFGYLVARYGAYNVTWSPSGEYLFTDDVEGWRELGEELHLIDPYGHPTSMHSIAPHSGSRHFQEEAWYDFNLIQVGHVLGFKNFMAMLPYQDYHLQPVKPVIMSESWYENHPNSFSEDGKRIGEREIRFAAYVSLLQGSIGQTYGAHGIWSWFEAEQAAYWSEETRPSEWQHDLQLPGSVQMKHVRALMESLAWTKLEPHPEWASTTMDSSVYCAAVLRQQYAVYCTGGSRPVPVMVHIHDAAGEGYASYWFDPRTGERTGAAGQYEPYGSGWLWWANTPDEQDWVLVLTRMDPPASGIR